MNKNIQARPTSGIMHFVERVLPSDPIVRNRDDKFFYCDLCGHREHLLSDLTAHIKNHLQKPGFCEICKIGFSTKDRYKWHMGKHYENGFLCQRCGDVFETVIELESHRRVEHGQYQDRRKRNLCPCHKCGDLIFKHVMKQHLKFAHKEGPRKDPYLCKICGAIYHNKPNYFNHMREHKGLKRLACGICRYLFMSEKSLESHKLKHSCVRRSYKCRYCDATFRRNDNRKVHENIKHIKKYTKQCPDCGKLFLTSMQLNKHSVVHTKIKNYKCTVCDQKFTAWSSLSRHKKIHNEDKKHECTECGLKFVEKYSLTRHLLVHTGEKPHKCLHCPQAFRQVYLLTKHVTKHHSTGE